MEKRLYGGNTQRKRYPRTPATQCRLLREPLGDGGKCPQPRHLLESLRNFPKLPIPRAPGSHRHWPSGQWHKITDTQGTRQPQTRTPWSVTSVQKKPYHPTWLCKGTNAITHRSWERYQPQLLPLSENSNLFSKPDKHCSPVLHLFPSSSNLPGEIGSVYFNIEEIILVFTPSWVTINPHSFLYKLIFGFSK